MISNHSYNGKWDALGIFASAACAVHCLLLPVFLTTLPFLGIEIIENKFLETITIIASLLIGAWALYNGYRKHHRKSWPLVVFISGMLAVLIANVAGAGRANEMWFKALGIAAVITAHIVNWKFSRQHTRFGQKQHEHSTEKK